MKKVYILDLNILTKQNLSIPEFLTLLSLYDIDVEYDHSDDDLKSLDEKGFTKIILEEDEKISVIKKKGKLLIESIKQLDLSLDNIQKQAKRTPKVIDPEIDKFVTNFRNLWKGLKPGAMGSQSGCKGKLIRWMQTNPDYSKDDIIKAAKTYLKSLNDYRYLQNADYFIFKRDLHGESSRLSAFIDEAESPEEEWSSTLT